MSMNESLQQALAEVITKTASGVEAGVAFLQQEIPEVVYQLLIWKGVESFVYFLIGMVMLIAWPISERAVWKHGAREGGWLRGGRTTIDEEAVLFGYFIIGFFVRLPFVIIMWCALNLTWLQIWLAPKVYLIEYASSLGK